MTAITVRLRPARSAAQRMRLVFAPVPTPYLLMIIPAIVIFTLFITLPAIDGMFFSLTNYVGYGHWHFIGFANYHAALTDPTILDSYGFTLLFAVAGGAAVGNLYWAQPLLDFISRDLHASPASAGWLVTATQVGYAAGIVLIVPLGDVLARRRLVPVIMTCAAVALVGCALAPSFAVLLLAITVLGLTTVAGQILIPLAGDLTDDAHRGRVVGTVVSGLLTGILVSRTISGLVAGAAGWRAIFAAAAAVDILLAILLYRAIPPLPPKTRMAYQALIA